MNQSLPESYCFCELAPLYALDLLEEPERQWVEQQVLECPDLEVELQEYLQATAAIPYSLPLLPVAPDLKERLFDRLGLETPEASPIEPDDLADRTIVRSQELQWRPHSVPGVKVAIVHRDEQKREVTGLLQAEPGVHYPFHHHATVEEIYMLEGDLIIGAQSYGAGDYIRSHTGSSHAPYTQGGCKFFFRTSMDDEYPAVALNSVP
jgi:quercetin dioxygenase-like cupin family protein